MLEAAMVRQLCAAITDAQIAELRAAPAAPRRPPWRAPTCRAAPGCWPTSTWCWRACWATRCWPQLLDDLLTRCSLIALMYQSSHSAEHSQDEHVAIVDALERRDARAAVRLMEVAPGQRRAQPAAEPARGRPGHGAATRLGQGSPMATQAPSPALPYARDLRGYGRQPPHARWPGDARIAVQFVLNYEEGGENNVLHGDPTVGDLPVRAGHRAGLREPPHDDGVDVRVRLARRRVAHPARVRAARPAAHRVRRGLGAGALPRAAAGLHGRAATRSPTTACAGSTTRTCPKPPSAAMSAWPRTC